MIAFVLEPCCLQEGGVLVFGSRARVRLYLLEYARAGGYVKEDPCCTSCCKWDKLISPKLQPRGL